MKYPLALRIALLVLLPALNILHWDFRAAAFAAKGTNAPARSLEECVERLARKAAALPHEERMSLVWINHAGLSEQRAENLRMEFVSRLEAAQIHIVQPAAAPAIRVAIEETPSQIVFTAWMPAEGGANVAIEEMERALAVSDERPGSAVRLEKELLWQQQTRILSAALREDSAADGQRKMILLTEDALQMYEEEQGSWKLHMTKIVPGPKQPQRAARGQLVIGEVRPAVGILLPGRKCEASLADDLPISCAAGIAEMHAGRLLAWPACGSQTWWLKSDGNDWASEDRLLLRNSGAGNSAAAVAELGVPGPVFSLGEGGNAASATAVVRNLSTGNYEVYRVALACTN